MSRGRSSCFNNRGSSYVLKSGVHVLKVPFLNENGGIVVLKCHRNVIEKLKEIASELGAKVLGDEGVLY